MTIISMLIVTSNFDFASVLIWHTLTNVILVISNGIFKNWSYSMMPGDVPEF